MKIGAIGADLIAPPQLPGGRVKGFTFRLKP
jgi:hypothetical protein